MPSGHGRAVQARGALRAAVLVLVSAFAVSACTVGPSSRPAVLHNDGPAAPEPTAPGTGSTVPPLGEPENPSVDWRPCDAETRERLGSRPVPAGLRFSCASVTSTVDSPDLPDRGVLRLALLKVGRGDVPLVVVNDVDGEPGTLHAARLAARLPPELLDRFALVGVDRRYTGESERMTCVPDDIRRALVDHDPAAPEATALLDAARTAGQQCSIKMGNDQGALDTWRTAGDLEQIRVQLGMSRLHALGVGEGSRVLGLYATRFPARTGRLVLDGMPDPSQDALTVLKGVAEGAEATLAAFARDCARRDCPLSADAARDVRALADRLRARPAPLGKGDRLGPGRALRAVATGLAQRERWPELATAVAEARQGRGARLAAFLTPAVRETAAGPPSIDTALATRCNDTVARLTPDRIEAVTRDWRKRHPMFGALAAQQLSWCQPWPVRREPLVVPDGAGAPPLLVISTAADPVTPELGTTRAANRMASARLLAWEGAGHGAVAASSCIAGKARTFLIDGTLPETGTRCPA